MPKQPNTALMMQYLYTSVMWIDSDFCISWANAQSEQLLAASRTRLIGTSILAVLSPIAERVPQKKDPANASATHSLAQQFANAQQYGQPFIDYNKYIIGISQPVYVDYSVTPVKQGEQTFFLLEMWGKSRQTRLDKERQLQEQHDVAKQMLRSVAHEVKNPLAGIRGAGQLLDKYTKKYASSDSHLVRLDGSKLMSYAAIIIDETDRLTRLIDDLLGSNCLPNWQQLNVHEPLEHVLMLTETRHAAVVINRDYDLSLPEITADKNQLIQVFLNLINNACDAMLEDEYAAGNPVLTVTTRIAWSHTIGVVRHAKVVKISIRDNGGGIDPELMGRIFFPLVTGRANGTGLGLSLVQDMVHRHSGAIEVMSEPGNTEFCVYLPFEQNQADQ